MRASWLAALLFLAAPACAQESSFMAESLPPAQAAEARALWSELRCVVCQGQSVAESHAPLAEDMRRLVLERVQEGDSPEAIRRYLSERYGPQILLKPPVAPLTWPLWSAPFLFLLLGAGLILRQAKRKAI